MGVRLSFPRRFWRRAGSLAAGAAALTLAPGLALAQVASFDLRTGYFLEPSSSSRMQVITPAVTVSGTPAEFITVRAGYAADIVSGASEPVKAGPSFRDKADIVSAASVEDVRHLATGGFTLHRGHTDLGASYAYGTENDYRSNTIAATASTDFFQRNTQLEFAFAHGFDKVCDAAGNGVQPSTARLALDASTGCFNNDETRRSLDVSTDNFQGAWTQSWTPVLATQLVLSSAVQRGFLSNPYRSVAIGPSGEVAQEHHPGNRARGAVAARIKYYVRPLEMAFGAGARAYRDTWDIISQTYEIDAEKSFTEWLRLQLIGRYYRQTEALFWSDDYTGGEPLNGPRGQYFSGDRELSPLSSFLGGARVTMTFHGHDGDRVGHLFYDFETSVNANVLKTFLSNFTWAGNLPDDTLALIGGLSVAATF
jgi:hypothetical protein